MQAFSFLLLFLLSCSVFARPDQRSSYHAEIAHYCKLKAECDSSASLTPKIENELTLLEISAVLACKKYYQVNHCDDVKIRVREPQAQDVISCDPSELCRGFEDLNKTKCLLDGAKEQFTPLNIALLIGAGIGGNIGLVATGASLPLLVYSAGASAEQCFKDIPYKKLAIRMHNLSLHSDERPLDVEGNDKALLQMQCQDLTNFLGKRLDTFAERRLEKDRWSLKKAKITPNPEAQAMQELLRSQNCFKPLVVKENICKGLVKLAVGGLASKSISAASSKLLTTEVKYKTIPMKEKYKGENERLKPVKYLTPSELEKMKVSVNSSGLLVNSEGKVLNIQYGPYVMDEAGNIYIHTTHKKNFFHHSSFLAGGPVAGAGHITVINGKIEFIDRSSGHYHPSVALFKQVLRRLKEMGASLKGAEIESNFSE